MAGILDQIIGIESGGNRYASNPRSSAYGPGQFIKSTWLDLIRRIRPDLASLPPDQLLAMRSDPQLSRSMVSAYADENGQRLKQAGLPVTPGTTYLAHFAGPAGATALLKADPTMPASMVLGPEVVKANPFLAGMSVGDVRAWSDRKMGGAQPSAPKPASFADRFGGMSKPLSPQTSQGYMDAPMMAAPPPTPPPMDMTSANRGPSGPFSFGDQPAGWMDPASMARTASGAPLPGITPDSNYWALFGPGMTGVPFFGGRG